MPGEVLVLQQVFGSGGQSLKNGPLPFFGGELAVMEKVWPLFSLHTHAPTLLPFLRIKAGQEAKQELMLCSQAFYPTKDMSLNKFLFFTH